MASEKTEQIMDTEKHSIEKYPIDLKPVAQSGSEAIKITYLDSEPDNLSVKTRREYTGTHDTSLDGGYPPSSTTAPSTVPTTSLTGKALETNIDFSNK